ncbi:hypothetical protein NDU88_005714 [Pleurodeles waltl]|uniref:Uncharacterized protein n=1 Tax=Pleurodeles waltl TaxID=8319 RepID=A0AAV7VMR9_PLEWA|nr:hypothetical protein NDU88_005714 [Pleurodeles waltl]
MAAGPVSQMPEGEIRSPGNAGDAGNSASHGGGRVFLSRQTCESDAGREDLFPWQHWRTWKQRIPLGACLFMAAGPVSQIPEGEIRSPGNAGDAGNSVSRGERIGRPRAETVRRMAASRRVAQCTDPEEVHRSKEKKSVARLQEAGDSGAPQCLLLWARRRAGPAGVSVEAPPHPRREHLLHTAAQHFRSRRRNLHGPSSTTRPVSRPRARTCSARTPAYTLQRLVALSMPVTFHISIWYASAFWRLHSTNLMLFLRERPSRVLRSALQVKDFRFHSLKLVSQFFDVGFVGGWTGL